MMSSSPAIMRRAVVLPQPDGPSRTMNSPSVISRSRSSTATTSSNRLVTFWNVRLATLTSPTPRRPRRGQHRAWRSGWSAPHRARSRVSRRRIAHHAPYAGVIVGGEREAADERLRLAGGARGAWTASSPKWWLFLALGGVDRHRSHPAGRPGGRGRDPGPAGRPRARGHGVSEIITAGRYRSVLGVAAGAADRGGGGRRRLARHHPVGPRGRDRHRPDHVGRARIWGAVTLRLEGWGWLLVEASSAWSSASWPCSGRTPPSSPSPSCSGCACSSSASARSCSPWPCAAGTIR